MGLTQSHGLQYGPSLIQPWSPRNDISTASARPQTHCDIQGYSCRVSVFLIRYRGSASSFSVDNCSTPLPETRQKTPLIFDNIPLQSAKLRSYITRNMQNGLKLESLLANFLVIGQQSSSLKTAPF